MKNRALDIVRSYHQRTKHHPYAYAKGPHSLDWADQPDPFRRYSGCRSVELSLCGARQPTRYDVLFDPNRRSSRPVSLETTGTLLELGFGLSAWKQYGGERWALRCNPSSGNLHPTEAYLVGLGDVGIESGVYHYVSHDHVLEQRCGLSAAAISSPALLVGLTSIHWREAWKYGERAYRYCQHDVGHALAALRYAAAVLGWRVQMLPDWSDQEIAALLGLDREEDFSDAEHESPDLLCRIIAADETEGAIRPDWLISIARAGCWGGRANKLSPYHHNDWPVIEEVSRAVEKPRTKEAVWMPEWMTPMQRSGCQSTAAAIILQRRSAQRFDGRTAISASAFFRMLDATLPRCTVPPLDLWPWRPRIHFILFVHRVDALPAGLYAFSRDAAASVSMQASMRQDFTWERVEGCPDHLPLFQLLKADCQQAARMVSCHQGIAADSAFSLGMIAEFSAALNEGPWVYRRLFWEAGLIGQILYLEAEACGLRGTGIGCFFDDPMHEILGLSDDQFQDLYHFTVGGPLEDVRLETLPPYAHLAK
jgi:SagB-type dehydrogenase family enzyme